MAEKKDSTEAAAVKNYIQNEWGEPGKSMQYFKLQRSLQTFISAAKTTERE
jgi:hypothetical protein